MRQTIRLTESELRNMIEMSINEAIEDEGLGGALGAIGGWFKNKAAQTGEKLANGAKQKGQQAMNYASNKAQQLGDYVGNKAQQVQQGYNNMKKTAQVGSNNQEAQKAIKNAVDALNRLIAVDQKMESLGGTVIGNGAQRQIIDKCIRALTNVDNRKFDTSISGRFQSRRDARMNPNARFNYESRMRRSH